MAGTLKGPASVRFLLAQRRCLVTARYSGPESDALTMGTGFHDTVTDQCCNDGLQPWGVVLVGRLQQTVPEYGQIQRFAWRETTENLHNSSSPDPVGLATVGWFGDTWRDRLHEPER